ncbi:MAG: hypothetical protein H8E42_06640 [Nitrospinae bacterium]|nr:hypothetical protein [Nitrospinota bacterium]
MNNEEPSFKKKGPDFIKHRKTREQPQTKRGIKERDNNNDNDQDLADRTRQEKKQKKTADRERSAVL